MVDNWTRPHLYVSCCEYMTFQTVVRAWMSVKLYLSQAGRLNVLGASLCGLIFKRDVPDDLGLEWWTCDWSCVPNWFVLTYTIRFTCVNARSCKTNHEHLFSNLYWAHTIVCRRGLAHVVRACRHSNCHDCCVLMLAHRQRCHILPFNNARDLPAHVCMPIRSGYDWDANRPAHGHICCLA